MVQNTSGQLQQRDSENIRLQQRVQRLEKLSDINKNNAAQMGYDDEQYDDNAMSTGGPGFGTNDQVTQQLMQH